MSTTDRAISDEARHRLLFALERHDTGTREARAERIIWHSRFDLPGAVLWDRHETAMLLEEARKCFTEGQFMANHLNKFMKFGEHLIPINVLLL